MRRFTHNRREWGAEFGFEFDAILSQHMQSVLYGVGVSEDALTRIQELQLIVSGTDARFRPVSAGREKALALLYTLWKMGLARAF